MWKSFAFKQRFIEYLQDHNFIQFDEKNEYLVKDMSTFYPPKNRNKGPETRIIFMKDPK